MSQFDQFKRALDNKHKNAEELASMLYELCTLTGIDVQDDSTKQKVISNFKEYVIYYSHIVNIFVSKLDAYYKQ
ncbi:MAG: hypothetical protein LBP53_08205 [Candidatus Peribacteria bacterium]|nr:hypothetical protein [Candidatus Peribacteria bacterium]